MDIVKIIDEKDGKIIKKGEDIFEVWDVVCVNNHSFKILANDIKNGKWCDYCEKPHDPVDSILKELDIKFIKDKEIDGIEFKYVIIINDRKFIIDRDPFNDEKFKIARNNNYNIIIIFEDINLKNEIWEALKNNKASTFIGRKTEYEIKHRCVNEEIVNVVSAERKIRSIIKRASQPYPSNVNIGVGYIRVSTEHQSKEGVSLEAQESILAQEAGRRNLFLRGFYIEEGISGKDRQHRLSLEKMMEELEEGEYVIVYTVSRFARNTKDLLGLVDEIEKKKAHLIIMELDVDVTTPIGKVTLTMIGSIAQFERESNSQKIKDALKHLKDTGQMRMKPHYGWRINPDRSPGAPSYERIEEEQRVIVNIRLLRERYPKMGIVAFARKLGDVGIDPPRKSLVWHHAYVKKIMIREGIK
jgi:DNA invertase Pin-like site-specific DNA recombinase